MHCGPRNQNFGWAMAHLAHAAAPPPMVWQCKLVGSYIYGDQHMWLGKDFT